MEGWSDIFAPLIGRILVGGYFLWNGIETALNLPGATANVGASGTIEPATVVVIFILIQVLCGCAVIVGYKTRPAALTLAVYALATTVLYTGFSTGAEQALFLQSMAVVGGLLYISAYGAGLWTTDWNKK